MDRMIKRPGDRDFKPIKQTVPNYIGEPDEKPKERDLPPEVKKFGWVLSLIVGFLIFIGLLLWINSCDSINAQTFQFNHNFKWTAPGDDGNIGTASEYVLVYSTDLNAFSDWQSLPRVPNLPDPSPSGSLDSVMVNMQLNVGTVYYFALYVGDEQSYDSTHIFIDPHDNLPDTLTLHHEQNWSGISNVIGVYAEDKETPNPVIDLNAVQ